MDLSFRKCIGIWISGKRIWFWVSGTAFGSEFQELHLDLGFRKYIRIWISGNTSGSKFQQTHLDLSFGKYIWIWVSGDAYLDLKGSTSGLDLNFRKHNCIWAKGQNFRARRSRPNGIFSWASGVWLWGSRNWIRWNSDLSTEALGFEVLATLIWYLQTKISTSNNHTKAAGKFKC